MLPCTAETSQYAAAAVGVCFSHRAAVNVIYKCTLLREVPAVVCAYFSAIFHTLRLR